MKDGHIHFHAQPYTFEVLEEMIQVALEKGIDELYLLDHTHKFKEFAFLYSSLKEEETLAWYNTKPRWQISVQEYINFIKLVKSKSWPIKLNFGLEVCFFKEHHEKFMEVIKSLEPFKFDFLIGSMHFVDGVGVDISENIYHKIDVDTFYKHYFKDMEIMIKTGDFTYIAHPDLFKKFNVFPSFSLTPYYISLAKTLKEYHQETENNSGLIRSGFPYPGLSPELLKIFKEYDVKFHKSSDAHIAKDIGRVFEELEENL